MRIACLVCYIAGLLITLLLLFIKNKKLMLILEGVFVLSFLITIIVLICKMPKSDGSIRTVRRITNIIEVDVENKMIYYEEEGILRKEKINLDYNKLKKDSVIEIWHCKSTSYEYWILGYNDESECIIIS
ncbi:MAG: hypothetical protein IJY14_01845 [Acholeplasmatales bacterium]|nr:hypothetical protein [Acholeplasmatales bacterium]